MRFVSLLAAFAYANSALCAPQIVEWSPATSGFSIDNTNLIVTITSPGTYKFQSLDGGNLANINLIEVADNVIGDVIIHVARDPNDLAGTAGAATLGSINLTNNMGTSLTGNLAELRITGSLNSISSSAVAHVTGDIEVGGDLSVSDQLARTFTADSITGNVTLGGMWGDLVVIGAFNGNLTVESNGLPSATPGDIYIGDDYGGIIQIKDGSPTAYNGTIFINGDLTGRIVFDLDAGSSRHMAGVIEIAGDVVVGGSTAPTPRIYTSGTLDRINGGRPPNIWIHGSISGATAAPAAPVIQIGDLPFGSGNQLRGTIAVDGSLNDAIYPAGNSDDHPEILVYNMNLGARAAIVVDYDGWDPGDDWASGARVHEAKPGPMLVSYSGNSPVAFVYEVTECLGDLNNDGEVTAADVVALNEARVYFLTPPADNDCFVDDYPGLEGSAPYHGDLNNDSAATCVDWHWLDHLVEEDDIECCPTDYVALRVCRSDFDHSGSVDLSDLAPLISSYGLCDNEQAWDSSDEVFDYGFGDCPSVAECSNSGAVNISNCIDLADMAVLLADFGATCAPCDELSDAEGDFDLSVAPYDTSGYTGGGFAGEDAHFVFDVLIEVDEEDDDWTVAGLCAARFNGAVFRLVDDPDNPPVPGATEPEKYTTFFGVPRAVDASGRFNNPFPTGGVAGSCHPLSGSMVYSTTTIHAAWLDWDVDSDDGPAAICRLVIDVSGVSGADTSGGLGSVYFSTTGPASGNDIKVASIHAFAAHKYEGGTMTDLYGDFYVVGE